MTITLTTIQTVPNSRPFWVKDFLFLFLFVLELLYWHRAVKDSIYCAVRSRDQSTSCTYLFPAAEALCASDFSYTVLSFSIYFQYLCLPYLPFHPCGCDKFSIRRYYSPLSHCRRFLFDSTHPRCDADNTTCEP